MSPLEKLIKQFERFPGVGSRQAKRFAFHILTDEPRAVEELATLIGIIRTSVRECPSCHRFHTATHRNECTICSDDSRDQTKLLIVERDSDIDAIERSRVYDGLYFVLGGTIPLLNTETEPKIRGGALKQLVTTRLKVGLNELILGFAVNPDGENTARYIETLLRSIVAEYPINLSVLGRGLSTGSELEYADPETIKNALANRSRAHNITVSSTESSTVST